MNPCPTLHVIHMPLPHLVFFLSPSLSIPSPSLILLFILHYFFLQIGSLYVALVDMKSAI